MSGIRVWNSFLFFSACLIPIWLKTMLKSCYVIFSIFLLFFSEFAPPVLVWAEFGSKIILSLSRPISPSLIPFWIKIMPESCFLIYWIFLLFFWEFSLPGRVWAEFRSKILFSLSRPVSFPICLKIMPKSSFLIFWIFWLFFFGIFSPGSSMSGIRV